MAGNLPRVLFLALITCGMPGVGSGSSGGTSSNSQVAKPSRGITPGTYDTPISVSISDFDSAATICYTTTGSTPSTSSTLYSGPIQVASGDTTTIEAIAVKSGSAESAIASGTYHVKDWVAVGTAGFTSGSAIYTRIAIDSSGTPYIAYRDGAQSNAATVMKYSGGSWANVGNAGFSAGSVTGLEFALDSNGVPAVAYSDDANSSYETVMQYNGSSWSSLGGAGFTPAAAFDTSLAFNGTVPYVSFVDC